VVPSELAGLVGAMAALGLARGKDAGAPPTR